MSFRNRKYKTDPVTKDNLKSLDTKTGCLLLVLVLVLLCCCCLVLLYSAAGEVEITPETSTGEVLRRERGVYLQQTQYLAKEQMCFQLLLLQQEAELLGHPPLHPPWASERLGHPPPHPPWASELLGHPPPHPPWAQSQQQILNLRRETLRMIQCCRM
ncbi:uncharacterized protein LOC134064036 isoform X2 [Sardina pilchardus]|uniref:uncharacterized protein LOC134064036 isoform X2 n=1 Tax=Sardina pilchardus TaxID=27697 RepID=UPI002E0D7C16